MKIVVAGNRTYKNHQHVYDVLNSIVQKSDIILHGGARGVDAVASTWARTHGIACQTVEADWDKFGPAAGRLRNQQMALRADALIAFWDGESPGTGNMIRCMQLVQKPIFYAYHDAQEES